MGLLDFVKDAGERLRKAATGQKADAELAERLDKNVHDLGLQVDGLQIEVKDDVATVRGRAKSQAEREKVTLVLGNTQGIARVDDRLEVANPEPEATFYTVKRGDSLSKIAKAHYGDAMKYPVIFEANRPMLKDPDKIYPGQVLRIPSLKA